MKKTNKKVRKNKSIKKEKNSENSIDEVSELILEARKYHDLKQLIQANYLYQQVLEIQPGNILALNGLGMIAMDAGMLSLSMELFNFALAKAPENIILNKNLALAYSRMAEFNAAIEKYIDILKRDATNAEVHGELARLYLQTGNMARALTHYHLAFRLNPSDPRNFHGLVQMDPEAITEENINMIESLLADTELSLDDRRSFYFALGAIYDASERYDEAFANFAVANMSKAVKFDSERHVEYISQVIETFTPKLFQQFNDFELCQSSQPVFIIGMPRSGTTLVEQILASHTDVYAGGELNLINDIAERLKLTMEQTDNNTMSFEYSSAESLSGFARYYLNDINNLAFNNVGNRSSRITDKMPTNFIYLGLIALLFPKAHVIHCRRNPLDVSLSCYFHDFAGDHGYACDLKDIGLYHQQYERLMDHWKQVLPMKIHTVEYKEMIKQPESTSRQLIEFVGLDWQSACKDFHRTKHQVNVNILQVREELDGSVEKRWRYYEKHLQTLKKTLDASENTSISGKNVNIQ